MKAPAPPRVDSIETFWSERPPSPSPRLVYWLERIADGWRPNRRVRIRGYDASAHYFGIYIWEELHVMSPVLYHRVGELDAAWVAEHIPHLSIRAADETGVRVARRAKDPIADLVTRLDKVPLFTSEPGDFARYVDEADEGAGVALCRADGRVVAVISTELWDLLRKDPAK